jgi:hypothetical protein
VTEDQGEGKQKEPAEGGVASLPSESVDLTITVSWQAAERGAQLSKQSFTTLVTLTWPEILLLLGMEPGKPKNRNTLWRLFSNSIAARFRSAIQRQGYARVSRLTGKIEPAEFDRILATLETAGYLQPAQKPAYVKQRTTYYQLTPLAIERIARGS